jgi:hypothetical protein
MNVLLRLSSALTVALLVVGCSALGLGVSSMPGPPTPTPDRFPDVLDVNLRPAGERVFDVAVTLHSPYDTPERYADGWRVLDSQGNVLGTHTLMHDHAAEQPFTRTQHGLHIPEGISVVTVEGRDQANGFGGATMTIPVPE